MIKRDITYSYYDDDGNEVEETKTYYFHLSEEEMLEWMSKYDNLAETLSQYIKDENKENLFAFFKKVLLDSYGHREAGGREFEKSPELRKKFEHSFAYKALFKELISDEGVAATFINGVFPKDFGKQDQDKPQIVSTTTSI